VVAVLERVVAERSAADDPLGAARATLLLVQIRIDQRQGVMARGLLQRASRWLDGQSASIERGHLAWMSARMSLAAGDAEGAIAQAREACRIGRDLHDADVECLGLAYLGHGLMSRGDMAEGLAQHDEAAAMIRLGGVCAWAAGWSLCSILYGARYRNDWLRAAQFAQAYEEWSRASRMPSFPGTCQLHRAAVLNVQGELEQAAAEVRSAAAMLAQAAPWAEGDAYCVLGDIQLSVGDLEDAEASYRQAHALGWNPQPGLARVHLMAGRAAEALRGLEQALDTQDFTLRERRAQLLCLLVHAAMAAGDVARARQAMAALDAEAMPVENESVAAMRSAAEAELALADGQPPLAMARLRRAIAEWRNVGSPAGEFEARLRLAECLLDQGDAAGAELELYALQAQRATAARAYGRRVERLRTRLAGLRG
jgi:tetratricopeptide (TPR) repeat protein